MENKDICEQPQEQAIPVVHDLESAAEQPDTKKKTKKTREEKKKNKNGRKKSSNNKKKRSKDEPSGKRGSWLFGATPKSSLLDLDEEWSMANQGQKSKFEFSNITYTIKGKKRNDPPKKVILDGVSASINDGHMMAIIGPSGAGKSSLLNVLSLSVKGRRNINVSGRITLNGQAMSNQVFQRDCFLVEQYDNHFPFLTCHETLKFASKLLLGSSEQHDAIVDGIIQKLGLESCQHTRVGNSILPGLSGGQKRRLSVGIALLKKPALLLLDEPTSGLDAAGAVAITKELKQLAVSESMCIVMTIHQPSTKVWQNFDQCMLLSGGKTAYIGQASAVPQYLASIGHPMDSMTNPAEFCMDLINPDFSTESEVESILDAWQEHHQPTQQQQPPSSSPTTIVEEGNCNNRRKSFMEMTQHNRSWWSEMATLVHRHTLMICRDPILYLGRSIALIVTSCIFGLVYWKSRVRTQDQAVNFAYGMNWFISVASLFGVVAVYVLHDEYLAISKEIKNGLIRPSSYILAKGILVIPIMFIFGICAISIGGYAILNIDPSGFGTFLLMMAISLYTWESIAEMFSVLNTNVLEGMLNYMSVWFAAFLFAGIFLPVDDIPVPIRWIHYILPYAYHFSAFAYNNMINEEWENCIPDLSNPQAVCIDFDQYPDENPGSLVLDSVGMVITIVSSDDNRLQQMGALLAIAVFCKTVYIGVILYNSYQTTRITDDNAKKEQ